MPKKTVLSERFVKSKAALKQMTLAQLNDAAGFGPNYIYRLWDSENVQLSTINKIAGVLECRACDLMEEIEFEIA